MNVRLRRLVAASCVGASAAIAACTASNPPGGAGAPSAVDGEYKGELSGPGLTGILDLTLQSGGPAPSATHALDTRDEEAVTGTLTLTGGATLSLTGSFDPDTAALTVAGGGYTLDGTLTAGGFRGTYAGPGGSGSFTLIAGSGAQVFCGAYTGQDTGVWNLVVGPSSAAGSIANDGGTVTSPLACTVSGASLSCQAASGFVADGTVSGPRASGQWHDGNGNGGSWSGGTGQCPVPGPGEDAGAAPDATTQADAGGEDSSSAIDADTTPETGTAPDASKGTDASAAPDSGKDDASAGSDAAPSVDAGAGTDAAEPTDAAACAFAADITSITAAVGGPNPTAITELGMGTGNYPIAIVTSNGVCPGASVVQISTGSLWTDLGTCAASGGEPSVTCEGIVIPAASLAGFTKVQLQVINPGQAAGTAYSFYVFQGSPSPVITGPASGSLVAGGGAQQITLTGTGLTGATVECDFLQDGGVAVVPTISSATSTSMTLQFPASFTAVAQPPFWTKVTVSAPVGGVAYWAEQIDVP
jgi:hypothetical protein